MDQVLYDDLDNNRWLANKFHPQSVNTTFILMKDL